MLERDSFKDRLIVTLFIVTTASLLLWALIKPYIVKSGVGDVVQIYTPIRNTQSVELPRPNSGGFRHHGDSRDRRGSGIGAAAARGSISRQGGLNS